MKTRILFVVTALASLAIIAPAQGTKKAAPVAKKPAVTKKVVAKKPVTKVKKAAAPVAKKPVAKKKG